MNSGDASPAKSTAPNAGQQTPTRLRWIAGGVLSLVLLVAVAAWGLRERGETARCGEGFGVLGTRCCGAGQALAAGRCAGTPTACGPLHEPTELGCVLKNPAAKVTIPGADFHVGPGDWEAQGVVNPRDVHVRSFQIDAYEVSQLRWAGCTHAAECAQKQGLAGDAGRAVSEVTFDEAAAFCAQHGGRLPTLDEFTLAMTGGTRRYPWGDTGLVCRRAAWGLKHGPCAEGGIGPDTVAAHVAGISREGVHDLAGNVAEWVISGDSNADTADVMGGSWSDGEAASLRGWNRRTVKKSTRDASIGFRCAYTLD